ncbi:MAG: hypothetical protein ACTSVY_07145 [Candidatus Helarchaeota archaeon]
MVTDEQLINLKQEIETLRRDNEFLREEIISCQNNQRKLEEEFHDYIKSSAHYKGESNKIKLQNKIEIKIPNEKLTKQFKTYVEKNGLQDFSNKLFGFIEKFMEDTSLRPCDYLIDLFRYPGESNEEPMLLIYFKDDENFDIVKLIDEVNKAILKYLVSLSKNIDDFKELRNKYEKFRLIIRRKTE